MPVYARRGRWQINEGRNLIEEDSWGAALVRQRVRALKI